jgi:hypothetical protein
MLKRREFVLLPAPPGCPSGGCFPTPS